MPWRAQSLYETSQNIEAHLRFNMVDIAPVQKPLKLSGGQTIQTFHFNDPSTAAAESGRRKATLPILMVNGGPGMSHRYLISLARRLSINRNRRVILYDQSGCGDSDASTDSREWTIARYVRELHEVIEKLHLGKFILYGHSWGGFLALEYGTSQYMMRPSPRNDASTNMKSMVEALIISNATAGTAEYEKYANILLQAVEPLPVRVRILELEAGGEHDNPEYQDLLLRYVYTKHLLRLPVEDWPPEIVSAFESKNEVLVDMNSNTFLNRNGDEYHL